MWLYEKSSSLWKFGELFFSFSNHPYRDREKKNMKEKRIERATFVCGVFHLYYFFFIFFSTAAAALLSIGEWVDWYDDDGFGIDVKKRYQYKCIRKHVHTYIGHTKLRTHETVRSNANKRNISLTHSLIRSIVRPFVRSCIVSLLCKHAHTYMGAETNTDSQTLIHSYTHIVWPTQASKETCVYYIHTRGGPHSCTHWLFYLTRALFPRRLNLTQSLKFSLFLCLCSLCIYILIYIRYMYLWNTLQKRGETQPSHIQVVFYAMCSSEMF